MLSLITEVCKFLIFFFHYLAMFMLTMHFASFTENKKQGLNEL